MVSNKTFEKNWILELSEKFAKKHAKASPELIEKVTKAFHLLDLLSKNELKFIFKGGTSLLLLLKKVHRFSIDIDIIFEMEKNRDSINRIESVLNKVVEQSPVFEKYSLNERVESGIPKSHYRLTYKSAINSSREHHILLDILFEENHYEKTIQKPIDCEFIVSEDYTSYIVCPSPECILGDKLTAFAPTTTGIPYGKEKELEIIKQLFDIENLFDEIDNLKEIKNTFENFAFQELKYRNLKSLNYNDVLEDIFNTSIILCAQNSIHSNEYEYLKDGISKITDYIFSKKYGTPEATVSASKAAYLSQLLLNDSSEYENFNEKEDLSKWKVEEALEIKRSEEVHTWKIKNINNLRKISPEAYFYVYKALELKNR